MKYKTNESTYIVANFSDAGASVLVDVYNLATDVKIVTADPMNQIVGLAGIYKYSFSAPAGQYLWVAYDYDTGLIIKYGKIIVGQGEDRLDELHKIHGLDSSSPMSVSATSRTAGAINQTISGSSTVTVTRT